jgi:RimJ/RimL family protein N-acetyltransferase
MTDLPSFATRRLILRPRDAGDVDDCLAMDADPQVRRFLHPDFRDSFDAAKHRAVLVERTQKRYGPGFGYWVIAQHTEPAGFCGWVELIPLDDVGPEIEIGWRLPQTAWGRGFATEAARAILDHGFAALGLAEIIAVTDPDNSRSQAVARRIGMRAAGRKRAFGLDLAFYVATAVDRSYTRLHKG